jgi:hypothetical protein
MNKKWTYSTLLSLLAIVVLAQFTVGRGRTERWFIPGPLGHEDGRDSGELGIRAYRTRAISGADTNDGGEWLRHNGSGAPVSFSHNLLNVFPPILYERHPEFFPQEGTRRIKPPENAQFWNPDLGREDVAVAAANAARDYFSSHREDSFSLGVNDGLIFGESAETKALVLPLRWFRERPDYSRLVFTFMNRAASELGKTHPDKYLGGLAYYWAENAPDFPVNPQVIPFLTADRSQGYDGKFRAEEIDLQRRWVAVVGSRRSDVGSQSDSRTVRPSDRQTVGLADKVQPRLGLYDYLEGGGFLIPRLHTRLLAENLRDARRLGFTDYYGEGHFNWGLDGPQPWLVAQLLRDPEQSRERLLDEYYSRYFKNAARPMRRFFERCEEQWMNQKGRSYWLKHYRNESQAAIFPSAVCRELRGYLTEAGLAVGPSDSSTVGPSDGRTRLQQRVQLVSDAFGVTERFVAFQEARDLLERRVLDPGAEATAIVADLQRFLSARDEFVGYIRDLPGRQPLALAPFDLTDYTKNDPVVGALIAIRERIAGRSDGRTVGQSGSQAVERLRAIAPQLPPQWERLLEWKPSSSPELSRNGSLDGATLPPRRIAEMDYEVSLPPEWLSRVEPAQFHRAEIVRSDRGNALRISGSKDCSVSQWNAAVSGEFYVAAVEVRGKISASAVAVLTFGWLDAQHRNLGFTTVRVPEGEWDKPVLLRQGGQAPVGAVWVGVGIRVQHQAPDDWTEISDFSLKKL